MYYVSQSLIRASLLIAILILPSLTFALPIILTPQENSGPFWHNVFHSSIGGGGSGEIKAWYDLADPATVLSTYDPISGDLEINVDIFSDFGLTNKIGDATGVGSGLTASFLDGGGGGPATIEWTFSNLIASSLATYLGGATMVTMNFLPTDYTSSTQGYVPNSWDDVSRALTLWGSGQIIPGQQKWLGTDLVAVAAPEPGSLILMGTGLLGLLGFAWRRRKQS